MHALPSLKNKPGLLNISSIQSTHSAPFIILTMVSFPILTRSGIHKLIHPLTLPSSKMTKMHSTSPIQIPAPTRRVLGLTTSSYKMSIYKALKALIFHLAPLALLIVLYLIFSCAHCLRCVLINCSFSRVAVCLSMYLLIKTNNI